MDIDTTEVLETAGTKNIDDMRESPSVELMDLLIAKGARVELLRPDHRRRT